MAIKWYRLNCEICEYNKITDGSDINLVEYQRSKIQGELPHLGPDNKTVTPKFKSLPKKFKCPQCGRLISAKEFKESETQNEKKAGYDEDLNKRGAGGFERT
jgi:rubredoxin